MRHLYGPFLGGDALDVDAARGEILTGSYRKKDALEVGVGWVVVEGL